MRTPRARMAARVARQSSLARNPLTSLVPCGDAGQHQRTMRNGFVAGHRHRAGHAHRRMRLEVCASEHGPRIRAQDLEQRGPLLQRGQRLGDRRIAHMAFDVDEEHVVPFALARGTRLDARHIDAMLRERLEQPEQRA